MFLANIEQFPGSTGLPTAFDLVGAQSDVTVTYQYDVEVFYGAATIDILTSTGTHTTAPVVNLYAGTATAANLKAQSQIKPTGDATYPIAAGTRNGFLGIGYDPIKGSATYTMPDGTTSNIAKNTPSFILKAGTALRVNRATAGNGTTATARLNVPIRPRTLVS